MIHLHGSAWSAMVSAHISEEGYEINLPEWSGRQTDVSQIDSLILFLQLVKSAATPADWLAPVPETEEDIKERAILADMKKEEDAAWYEAATEEELASQGGNSGAYLDDYDDDDEEEDYFFDRDYVVWDEEEEEEPEHAILDLFGDGKCTCPYCNSECAPDYCYGCHSTLMPPAIKPETRDDLPDEPPF